MTEPKMPTGPKLVEMLRKAAATAKAGGYANHDVAAAYMAHAADEIERMSFAFTETPQDGGEFGTLPIDRLLEGFRTQYARAMAENGGEPPMVHSYCSGRRLEMEIAPEQAEAPKPRPIARPTTTGQGQLFPVHKFQTGREVWIWGTLILEREDRTTWYAMGLGEPYAVNSTTSSREKQESWKWLEAARSASMQNTVKRTHSAAEGITQIVARLTEAQKAVPEQAAPAVKGVLFEVNGKIVEVGGEIPTVFIRLEDWHVSDFGGADDDVDVFGVGVSHDEARAAARCLFDDVTIAVMPRRES